MDFYIEGFHYFTCKDLCHILDEASIPTMVPVLCPHEILFALSQVNQLQTHISLFGPTGEDGLRRPSNFSNHYIRVWWD